MRHLLAAALLCALAGGERAALVAQLGDRPLAAPAGAERPLPDFRDATLRQVVRLSSGGRRLRVRLSNEMSQEPLRIGAVRVAIVGTNGAIVPGSSRVVTFGEDAAVRLPAHAPMVSDPIDLPVKPLQRLAISLYLPDGAAAPTRHSSARAISQIAPGDQTAAVVLATPVRFEQRAILAGVDVESARAARTIVAFGDSITDGSHATVDADRRYPDRFAERLQRAGLRDVAVANLGIGGNRLLEDGTGLNALARLDRDVLSVPGVSHVVVLEGINDIGSATREKRPLPTADMLIDAYRQIVARAHAAGVKVVLATILPYKGAGYWSEDGERVRSAVNAWIRTQREADGIADFDRATRDPADPLRMAKVYDSGDALHPNDAGFAAMAGAIDLKTLR